MARNGTWLSTSCVLQCTYILPQLYCTGIILVRVELQTRRTRDLWATRPVTFRVRDIISPLRDECMNFQYYCKWLVHMRSLLLSRLSLVLTLFGDLHIFLTQEVRS